MDILIPEGKQCHSLLSKVMRKNGVEVYHWLSKSTITVKKVY